MAPIDSIDKRGLFTGISLLVRLKYRYGSKTLREVKSGGSTESTAYACVFTKADR